MSCNITYGEVRFRKCPSRDLGVKRVPGMETQCFLFDSSLLMSGGALPHISFRVGLVGRRKVIGSIQEIAHRRVAHCDLEYQLMYKKLDGKGAAPLNEWVPVPQRVYNVIFDPASRPTRGPGFGYDFCPSRGQNGCDVVKVSNVITSANNNNLMELFVPWWLHIDNTRVSVMMEFPQLQTLDEVEDVIESLDILDVHRRYATKSYREECIRSNRSYINDLRKEIDKYIAKMDETMVLSADAMNTLETKYGISIEI